jgi:hypothetical protein
MQAGFVVSPVGQFAMRMSPKRTVSGCTSSPDSFSPFCRLFLLQKAVTEFFVPDIDFLLTFGCNRAFQAGRVQTDF